jgi:hypothetical protein
MRRSKLGSGRRDRFETNFLRQVGTLFVAGAQSRDYAVGAKAVETLFRRHSFLQHVETYGAHQFAVEAPRGHGDFRVVGYGVLGGPVQLVQR